VQFHMRSTSCGEGERHDPQAGAAQTDKTFVNLTL
jgi:hypothetical protein